MKHSPKLRKRYEVMEKHYGTYGRQYYKDWFDIHCSNLRELRALFIETLEALEHYETEEDA